MTHTCRRKVLSEIAVISVVETPNLFVLGDAKKQTNPHVSQHKRAAEKKNIWG